MPRHKGYCIVDSWWTPEEVEKHSCTDGSHFHISHRERDVLYREGFLEPATQAKVRVETPGFIRPEGDPDYLITWLIVGKVMQMRRRVPIRGLTEKVGDYHAAAIRSKQDWALTMLAQIQTRYEPRISKV